MSTVIPEYEAALARAHADSDSNAIERIQKEYNQTRDGHVNDVDGSDLKRLDDRLSKRMRELTERVSALESTVTEPDVKGDDNVEQG